MIEYQLTLNFIIALLLGVLIGLEREYSQVKYKHRKYGGIRTFSLIALLGGFAGFFGQQFSIWIAIVAFIALVLLILISHYFFSSHEGRVGITTEMAGLVTFFIGMLSMTDHTSLAIILAVLMTFLLYERTALHSFAEKLKKEEMYSTVKFAIIAFVILPLLPNTSFGPYNFFNPRIVWLMVVLVSGISFLGYIAAKLFGVSGIRVSSFLGGFASSTATTLSLIQLRSRQGYLQLGGILVANAAMMIKILVFVYILDQEVFSRIILPTGLMLAASGLLIMLYFKYGREKAGTLKLQSPFMILPALKFAAIFSFILFGVNLALANFGTEGVYYFSFLSGLFDADGTALGALQITSPGLAAATGASIILAIIANTLSKGFIAFIMGDRGFAKKLSLPIILISLAGALALYLL